VLLPWMASGKDSLILSQEGTGRAWASIRSLAAVPPAQPVVAGYKLTRQVVPVSQSTPGQWSRGDVYRVRIHVHADAPMNWVVLSDPIPAGATILGSGLGRDSAIETAG